MLARDGLLCVPCAEKLSNEAQAAGGGAWNFSRVVDSTVCSVCHADFPDDLGYVNGQPVCRNCAKTNYAHELPLWLKASLAGVLLLLVAAWWREAPYFRAGRHLVLAQRAMEKQDYKAAAPHFLEVLKVSPGEQKVILSGAKASILAGDPATAQKFLDLRKDYEADEQFNEVNALWKRSVDALDKADRAAKLNEDHKTEEAARLMTEASQEYPQFPSFDEAALELNASAAIDRKDYDKALQYSKEAFARYPGFTTAEWLTGSLATKYAQSGDPTYRKQAEDMLAQAQSRAQSPEEQAEYAAFNQRMRHRIDTREILTRDEYNRRYGIVEAKR